MHPYLRHEPLANTEEFFSTLLPMWIFDRVTLAFVEVNAAALCVYGYSRQEFLAMTILDIRPSEEVRKLLRTVLLPHSATGTTWSHRKKSGTVFSVRIFSREISFNGRRSELVIAKPIESLEASLDRPSAQNLPETMQARLANSGSIICRLDVAAECERL
jgi:PAS domain S-box-containing protein